VSDTNDLPNVPTDLPPVEPPNAGFVVQLFIIPAIVVCVVIGVWLLFGKLAGGERDVNEYVRIIRSESANRRFRAAYELASLIHNEKSLRSDPKLLGDLAELFENELSDKNGDNAEAKQFLAVALGLFDIDAGQSTSGKPIQALPVLARGLSADQPTAVRRASAESLARHAARLDGTLETPEVIAPLAEASASDETELRLLATYALGFCGGDAAKAALRGRLSDSYRDVAFNAAFALIRRDDPAVLDTLRELLSRTNLEQTIALENPTEKASTIEAFQIQALKSLQAAIRGGGKVLAQSVTGEVEKLAAGNLVSIQVEAKAVLDLLKTNAGS
jgi:hypothetical protein